MTHHRFILSMSLALAIAAPTAFAADRDIDKVNGSIAVEDGERYGDLETVNGRIEVGDHARIDDAATVNGGISIGASTRVGGGLETVNGDIEVGEQVTVNGGVETVNGEILIGRGGQLRGDLATVNGAVGLIDTDLAGDIEMVNGDLTVGAGSHVRGGIHYDEPGFQWFSFDTRKPRVVIGPNATVDGPLKFEREVDLYVHSSAQIGSVTGATAVRYEGEHAPREP